MVLLLCGCQSATDVIAKERPAVEAVFARVAALEPKAVDAPVVTDEGVKAPSPIVFEGDAKNAMFIYVSDLAHPSDPRQVAHRTLDSIPFLQCGALLGKGQLADSPFAPKPSETRYYLVACERLQYVLVIRHRSYVAPKLQFETRKFSRGTYEGEVLVFDLASGANYGGYTFRAANDDSVLLADAQSEAEHERRLVTNLDGQVFDALRAASRVHLK